MVAGARTFSLEDTFLAPHILNPPPTRHALLAFLLALAAVLHIGTAAWGDLFDGTEGQIAGGAREMSQSKQWLLATNNGAPTLDVPPFSYWAVAASYKIFGVSATAARIPIALAMIAAVAFTFLIGERLAGYWRGFAAGLIHLCSLGGFLYGRLVSPGPLTAVFVSAAIYCVVRGYQHRKFRRIWFLAFTVCTGLACLTAGLQAILYPAGICLLLALFFREARSRFQPLLHWTNVLLFLLLVAPWFIWAQLHFPGFWSRSALGSLGGNGFDFVMAMLGGWWPALFLLLPALLVVPRKIFRPEEFTAADALPLTWIGVVLAGSVFTSRAETAAAVIALPGFALFAASAWERIPARFRAWGILSAILPGLIVYLLVLFAPDTLEPFVKRPLPDWLWLSIRPLAQIVLVALLAFSIAALLAVRRQRGEIALLLALGAMAPIGFCLTEARARVAPFFSLADAAQYLNPRLGAGAEVVVEGTAPDGNSLVFYLDKKFFHVNQKPGHFENEADAQSRYLDEHAVLEAWERSSPVYLIIGEERVSSWRRLITDRVHIYHQVTTCGSRVILSNQL